MKIINHGVKVDKIMVIRFECQICWCEWLATVNECESVSDIYFDYKCRCPECGEENRVKMIAWHNTPKKYVAEWEQ